MGAAALSQALCPCRWGSLSCSMLGAQRMGRMTCWTATHPMTAGGAAAGSLRRCVHPWRRPGEGVSSCMRRNRACKPHRNRSRGACAASPLRCAAAAALANAAGRCATRDVHAAHRRGALWWRARIRHGAHAVAESGLHRVARGHVHVRKCRGRDLVASFEAGSVRLSQQSAGNATNSA